MAVGVYVFLGTLLFTVVYTLLLHSSVGMFTMSEETDNNGCKGTCCKYCAARSGTPMYVAVAIVVLLGLVFWFFGKKVGFVRNNDPCDSTDLVQSVQNIYAQ